MVNKRWALEGVSLAFVVAALGACGGGGQGSEPDAAVDGALGEDGSQLWSLEELVERYESGAIDRDAFRAALAGFGDSGIPAQLTDIESTTLLKARSEPYLIRSDITVAAGAILVLEQGTTVLVAPEVNVTVDGRLYAVGSESDPIRLQAESSERWGVLSLRNGPNQVVWTEIDRPYQGLYVTHSAEVRTLVDQARFDSWGHLAIYQLDSGNLRISNSQFGYQTLDEDVAGETIRALRSGSIWIQGCDFNYRRGYRDVIDLQECVGDTWPVVAHNTFDGGEDDAVDLDSCSAFVVGNVIRDFRPENLSAPYAGVNGGGVTGDQPSSRPIIVNNLIDNCYHGIGFKNGAQPVMVNNTITNSNIGVTLYQSAAGEPMPHGLMINNVLAGNLGWLNGLPQDVVLNGRWWPGYNQAEGPQATLEALYNITATSDVALEGTENSVLDPQLIDVDGVPVPGPGSPARDSGLECLFSAGVPMAAAEYLVTDARGAQRIFDGECFTSVDRGAVEAEPAASQGTGR